MLQRTYIETLLFQFDEVTSEMTQNFDSLVFGNQKQPWLALLLILEPNRAPQRSPLAIVQSMAEISVNAPDFQLQERLQRAGLWQRALRFVSVVSG